MEETKLKFKATRNITKDEIRALLEKNQGKAIMLNDLPENTQWTLKIKEKPTVTAYSTEDFDDDGKMIPKSIAYINVEYKYNDARIPLRLRLSMTCYGNFMKSNGEKEFIDKYAIFSKTIVDNKNYQSVGVIYKEGFEPREFVDPLVMMNAANEIPAPGAIPESAKIDLDKVKEWVNNFKVSVAQYNSMKETEGKLDEIKPITVELCVVQYFKTKNKEIFEFMKGQF